VAVRPQTHRTTTLARRQALLEAAVELVAEQGVGGITHRAVAKRAGLPLSTTSYFFESLDDLVLEALRVFVAAEIEVLEGITRALADEDLAPEAVLDRFVAVLLAEPAAHTVAQFEAYLEVTRRPDLRAEIEAVLAAYEQLAATTLEAAGADPAGARAFVALADGFALQRLARGEADADALRAGMRALFVAYTMDEGERTARLA
jgi:DNA-binding transcriptional regulator YbjK